MKPTDLKAAFKAYEDLCRSRDMRRFFDQHGYADLTTGDLAIRLPQGLTCSLFRELEEVLKQQLRNYGVDI